MAHPTSIRRSLLLNLVVVVLLLGTVLLGMTFVRTWGTMQRVSEALITLTLERTEVELRGFFDPVHRQLLELRDLSRAGLYDAPPDRLDELLGSFMREHRWVSATMLADAGGREHMLMHAGSSWRSRRVPLTGDGQPVVVRAWREDAPDPTVTQDLTDYDPRTRPWYRGALAGLRASGDVNSSIHWTEPYLFSTSGNPGITASIAFRDDNGEVRVIGLNLTLVEISNFITNIDVFGSGFAYVLSEAGSLVGIPRGGRYADDEVLKQALLTRPGELDVPIARDIAAAFLGDEATERATRFTSGNAAWWGDTRRVPLSPGSEGAALILGVAVPEAALLQGVQQQRLLIGVLTLIVLAVSVARAVGLARRYSRPLEALVAESERIRAGDLEPGPPIGTDVAEVLTLARAHDRMRAGLRALLRIEDDLKIARMIQEKTYPAQLPTVRGFDLAAWSEPADQTGGDTYDIIGLRTSADDRIVLTNGRAGQAVLLLADATGHGIGPALSVTQVRAMLRIAVRMSSDLSAIATHINTQLCEDLPGGRFVTCWLGRLDSETGTLTSVSGGQAPLLRYVAADDEFEVRTADSPPFGLFDVAPIDVPPPLTMAPGDIFAVMSDGTFEATSPAGEEFGAERVREVIRARRDGTAAEILAAVRQAEERFTRGQAPVDDRTIIIVKRVS